VATAPGGAPRHDAWAEAIPHIEGLTVLLLGHDSMGLAYDGGGFAADYGPAEKSALVFGDLSALVFDLDHGGALNEIAIDLHCTDVNITGLSAQGDGLEIYAASKDFVATHGTPDAYLAGLPKYVEESVQTALVYEIEDQIDPPMGGEDLAAQQSWTEDDQAALRAHALTLWYGLGGRNFCLNLRVQSGISESDEEAYADVSVQDRDGVPAHGLQWAFHTLFTATSNLTRFDGYEWEYNDGAHNRRSGYNQYAMDVLEEEIHADDTPDMSNHAILAAPDKVRDLVAQVRGRGLNNEDADKILEIGRKHMRMASAW